ncbi:MAG TPA: UDP-phosphate galactose phosphotransferase [candidate division Zixibacteria bacterium]|nr:UDP-phosphate galactose phosphotransferase [candidate division Zixibacteria bacterium]
MLRENLRILRRLVFVADLCLVALGYELAAILENTRFGILNGNSGPEDLIVLAVIIWGLVFWYQPKCYIFRLRKLSQIIISPIRASAIASGIFLASLFAVGYFYEDRIQLLLFTSLATSFLIGLRLIIALLLYYYRARGYNYQTVLIIGTGDVARGFADKILINIQYGLKILGFLDWERRPDLWRYRDIPCIGYLNDLPDILRKKQVDFVVFAVSKKYLDKIEESLQICEQMGVRVSVLADFFPMKISRHKIESFFGSPMLCYDPTPGLNFPMILKNLLDRFLAALGIILASPVMLVAALAVKLNSPGPAIFKQPRCGLNGRKFKLYKFRTMIQNAEDLKKDLLKFNEVDGAAFKMKNDPRITRVGKFLRKTSIDELPQLINILRGDMSFVGPRPPLADEVMRFDLWQRRKLSMKPGLTCLWQISGRSDVSFDQWMKLDLEYIDNWSLWHDAQILARTVPAVLKGTGAR